MLALRRYFARDVQLPGSYVEVGRGYADREVHGDAGRGHGAAVGFFGYTAHGARAQEVVGLDQVVGVPLRSCSVHCGAAEGRKGLRTMSSGSSGRRVAKPEPSLSSICCLIRRMVATVRW